MGWVHTYFGVHIKVTGLISALQYLLLSSRQKGDIFIKQYKDKSAIYIYREYTYFVCQRKQVLASEFVPSANITAAIITVA